METKKNTTPSEDKSESVTRSVTTCNCVVESLLKKRFSSRSWAEQDSIVRNNKPVPQLNITSKTKTFVRRFKNTVYTDIPWICGCAHFQKFYCWPCLLFSVDISVWNKNGFNDLNNLSKGTKRHECSQNHIGSCVKLRQFASKKRTECQRSDQFNVNSEKYNKTVTANRYIVCKLIDVVCFLSKHDLTFSGHSETLAPDNTGNYIELLYLLSTPDTQLKMHLEQSKVFTGLLTRIQNVLIQSVANIILEEIKTEINAAKFVSIIIDDSTDLCHRSQLSTVFRYVTDSGTIIERFVGFTDASENRDATALLNHIVHYLDEYNCRQKLIAHTYDGAAVMATEHNGVQAKIKEKNSSAIFVHCYAHRLNLVFSQSVSCIKECKVFFQSLTGFALFFCKSTIRSYAFDEEIRKLIPTVEQRTRWNSISRVLSTVLEYNLELKTFLLNIIENSEQWDSDTVISARGLYSYLVEFDFNFLLQVFSKIFPTSDILFDRLQEKCFDISCCSKKVDEFIHYLQSRRTDFDSMWNSLQNAEEGEELCKVQARKRRKVNDNNVEERKASYKRLYLEIIDTLIRNTKDRFADVKKLSFMALLDVSKFNEYSTRFPETVFNALKQCYGTFFNFPKLRSELIYMYASPDFAGKTLRAVNNYISEHGLADVFVEVYGLMKLIFAVPVTSASAECSYSTMKRIQTYIGNSLNEERLTPLAIIAIEKQLLMSLKEARDSTFYERVIDDFSKKETRIELQYATASIPD